MGNNRIMGKAALVIAAAALAPLGLLASVEAFAARSVPAGKAMAEECEERRGAPVASIAPLYDIRLARPGIAKKKRRYIRM